MENLLLRACCSTPGDGSTTAARQHPVVLAMGCGGGYDVFCALPMVYRAMEARSQNATSAFGVVLGSLSFSLVDEVTGRRFGDCVEVTPSSTLLHPENYKETTQQAEDLFEQASAAEAQGDFTTAISLYKKAERMGHDLRGKVDRASPLADGGYFPEYHLSCWLEKQGIHCPVYCFKRNGVVQLRESLNALVPALGITHIMLVDGGTDSLCFGDEDDLGTPAEDMSSIAAVWTLDSIPNEHKSLAAIGFGVELTVSHTLVLENIATLIKDGGLLACSSVLGDTVEGSAFRAAHDYASSHMQPSIVCSSIIASMDGHFGDYHPTKRTEGTTLFINPLMSQYWLFKLQSLASHIKYLPLIKTSRSFVETSLLISQFHASVLSKRCRKIAFDLPTDHNQSRLLDCTSECDNVLATTPLTKISALLHAHAVHPDHKLAVLLTTGSFNPPHIMHLQLMEIAKIHLEGSPGLSVVGGFISPSHDKYIAKKFRLEEERASAQHRCKMCDIATSGHEWISCDKWECNQYMEICCDTVSEHLLSTLRDAFPEHAHRFLVIYVCGIDVFPSVAGVFDSCSKEISCLCVAREGYNATEIGAERLVSRHPTRVAIACGGTPLPDVSSTHVRHLIATGGDTSPFIDPHVADYIRTNHLFSS
ncbi:cell surface glycoprotein [Pelomyxa schiedti]|nr:cell surface glycoprotein [Pelomyxa schiedti]